MSIFNSIEKEIKKLSQNKGYIVIGIDGPTASGKTFFAKKYSPWIFTHLFCTGSALDVPSA